MWVVADAREAERFDAFFARAWNEIAAARDVARSAEASCGQREAPSAARNVLNLSLELSALLLLLRAAREGDLPLPVAQGDAQRLSLAPLPWAEPGAVVRSEDGKGACNPRLVQAGLRMETLRARLVPWMTEGQADVTQGHDGKSKKPLRRPVGRPRLRLVVTNP